MTVLSAQSILERRDMISPMLDTSYKDAIGNSHGLSACGYDISIAEKVKVDHRLPFVLTSSLEKFRMPDDVVGIVHDKSTWARRGLAVQNTVIEPGWCGYLTLELSYNKTHGQIYIPEGCAIAQVIFHLLDKPTDYPYSGKYQNQEAGPQEAR